jgi:hypothetical protein
MLNRTRSLGLALSSALVACGGTESDLVCTSEGVCTDQELATSEDALNDLTGEADGTSTPSSDPADSSTCQSNLSSGDQVPNTKSCARWFGNDTTDPVNYSTDIDYYFIDNDGVTHENAYFSSKAPPYISIRCTVYEGSSTTALATATASPASECRVTFTKRGWYRYYLKIQLYGTWNSPAATQIVANRQGKLPEPFYSENRGTLSTTTEVDTYWLTPPETGMYEIAQFGSNWSGAAALCDPYVYVYDANWNLVVKNDDYDGLNSRAWATLNGGQTYHIIADNYADRCGGDYTLTVELLADTL